MPYRKGYDFTGWKITEGDGNIVEETDSEGRYVYLYDCSYNGNVTIEAQWQEKIEEGIKIDVKKDAETIKDVISLEDKKYVVVEPKSSIAGILNDFDTNLEKNILVINAVKTNEEVLIEGSNEKTNIFIIVKGDLNSDGKVNFKDVIKLNNYRLNQSNNEKNWNSAQKLAYKTLSQKEITDYELTKISFKDVITLNNYRIRMK